MTEEVRFWTVDNSREVKPLEPIQEMPTELEFEDLLVRNPEMLESGLELVGRQTPTHTGWLDLLAVDGNGRLVVYELKRGKIVREAVAQVLDYASNLDAMNPADLAEHIAERSGNDGIQGIDDFEQWYAAKFGGGDLARLVPPRMVLIGLGIDPVAERMVRFISGGSVDLSVVTFQGFKRGRDRLLARQMEVQPGQRQPGHRHRSETVDQKRRALRKYLACNGYRDLFDVVCDDFRKTLSKQSRWEEPGKTGIGFQLSEPDNREKWRTYFGVYAGWPNPSFSVSILPGAISWGGEAALKRLRKSIDLRPWGPGGFALSFDSEERWAEIRPAVLKFIEAVMENRSGAAKPGT